MITFEIKRRLLDSYYPLIVYPPTIIFAYIIEREYIENTFDYLIYFLLIIPSAIIFSYITTVEIENGVGFTVVYVYGVTKREFLFYKILSLIIFPIIPLLIINSIFDEILNQTLSNLLYITIQILLIGFIGIFFGLLAKNSMVAFLISTFLSIFYFFIPSKNIILDILFPFFEQNYLSFPLLILLLILLYLLTSRIELRRR